MDKEKAKRVLFQLSSPAEKEAMSALELADLNKNYQKFDKTIGSFEQNLQRLTSAIGSNAKANQIDMIANALVRNLEVMRTSMETMKMEQVKQMEVISKAIANVFHEMKDEMIGSLGRIRGVLENQDPKTLSVPLYKSMIDAISGVKDSIDKKPVPVWRWPQYASVSVRDKNFANVDPAVAYQHNSATESLPYGTLPVFDNAGTIAKVSSSAGLPVDIVAGSVSITSPGISGLKVDLAKFSLGTPSLSGLQTVLNGSKSTIPVSLSGNQAVNIAAASTPVLTGIRMYVNNPTGSQAVPIQDGGNSITVDGSVTATISSPSLAGLATNLKQLAGAAVDVNSGNKSAGTQRVVLATDQPQLTNALLVDGSGHTQPVSGTVTATISSPGIAGLSVIQKMGAVPLITSATVGIAASTSGDNTIIGSQSGKSIYVYAWNLSFSGTVNAKFTDAVTSKLLAGLFYGVANAGGGNSVSPNFTLSTPNPYLFKTSTTSRLILNLSAGTAVGGTVSYFIK